MKAFHTIAVPHKDILEGRLTLDVFAADLWQVFSKRGPDEYKDSRQFFDKTFVTKGLQNLLDVIGKRLKGKGGDPVVQIQTPFGGGKTHSLIAMYHKASEWKANCAVIVGTVMSPQQTLWGMLEEQLTGKIQVFKDPISPGREAIYKLLVDKQPLLILMDEVLEHVTKAAGVKVEASTLAAQTMAFMQELTEAVATLDKTALAVTLPSSIMEHYDEQSEKLFGQLQKVSGRIEKIYTPVEEKEISQVIRQRLFSSINSEEVAINIKIFMDYAIRENMIPAGTEPSDYRKRFEASYPFIPEVIDTLYHRWGSFPNFQRTRGVLRLLSLVIHSLKDSSLPYITLADFGLNNQELRRELLKHIGNQFDSVIGADITDEESGARKADKALGDAYKGLKLASRTANTIFLYSFSGGQDKGATLGEIKLNATTMQNPSSVIVEALEDLKGKLFYVQHESGKSFFSNQPNLNRILLTKIENIDNKEIDSIEKDLIKKSVSGSKLSVLLFPQKESDVSDNMELKLIILKSKDEGFMKSILEKKGASPRIYRNTMFFLVPLDMEQSAFLNSLKRSVAYKQINEDKTINLSDDQKRQVKNELKKHEDGLNETLRRYYRVIYIPVKDGFKEVDLGIPTYGEVKKLDDEVYEKLRSEGDILERIFPLLIKERYLKENQYVLTEQLYQSCAKTPGEFRVASGDIWSKGISDGIKQGLFGLGELENGNPTCRFYKTSDVSVSLSGEEVIVREELCKVKEPSVGGAYEETQTGMDFGKVEEETGETEEITPTGGKGSKIDSIKMTFTLPKGKVHDFARVLNLIQSKFGNLEIDLKAQNGEMTEQEFNEKIREAFKQMGIEI